MFSWFKIPDPQSNRSHRSKMIDLYRHQCLNILIIKFLFIPYDKHPKVLDHLMFLLNYYSFLQNPVKINVGLHQKTLKVQSNSKYICNCLAQ